MHTQRIYTYDSGRNDVLYSDVFCWASFNHTIMLGEYVYARAFLANPTYIHEIFRVNVHEWLLTYSQHCIHTACIYTYIHTYIYIHKYIPIYNIYILIYASISISVPNTVQCTGLYIYIYIYICITRYSLGSCLGLARTVYIHRI